MVKHTHTIRRLLADELFDYFWSFCGVGAKRFKIRPFEIFATLFRGSTVLRLILIFPYSFNLMNKTYPSARTTHRCPFSKAFINDFFVVSVSCRQLIILNEKDLGSPLCHEGTKPHCIGNKILSLMSSLDAVGKLLFDNNIGLSEKRHDFNNNNHN